MMRRKIYAAIFALIVTAVAVAASGFYRGSITAAPRAASATELLSMLPAADAVAYLDAQRMLTEVVPHIFINDSATFARVNQEIDKFKEHTGTDARQFDSIAIAARFKNGSAMNTQYVMGLVRGRFNASEAINTSVAKAKAEAEAKKRSFTWKEEQFEGTTISVERPGGFCMAAVDANTIAFGDLEGIKAMLGARAGRAARVDSSLTELATLNPSAVAGFAANVPPSAVKQMVGADEFGEAFNSIRQVYGNADATGATGTLNVTLRSETGEQAQALAEKLGSLRQLAALFLSRSDGQPISQEGTLTVTDAAGKREVTVRSLRSFPFPSKWVKDVTITAEGSDVKLRLEEPLSDMAGIFSGIR
jgi:hypothetical protein